MIVARYLLAILGFVGAAVWTLAVLEPYPDLVNPAVLVAALSAIAYGAVRAAQEDARINELLDAPEWLDEDEAELPYRPIGGEW
ncbi:hypothetical protein AB0K45_09700 [Micrococcus luteus]|uniref:hypothetical protein n=1 Tax=Micrococcus luteus TaxID=1270 RepID=UPI0034418D10